MNRQVYPKYKPSGEEWLGEIPANRFFDPSLVFL